MLQNSFCSTTILIEHLWMAASEKNQIKKPSNFTFPYHSLYFLGIEGPVWIIFCQVQTNLRFRGFCNTILSHAYHVPRIAMSHAYLCRQISPNHYP